MLRTDGGRLLATRGVRGFADGLISIVLAAYLESLGFSGIRIGVIVTGMMLGSAVATIGVGTFAHPFARRRLLMAGSIVMIVSGLGFAAVTVYPALLFIGVVGTMNPTGGDISVFLPIEQSVLATTAKPEDRTLWFARYAFTGSFLGACGALAARMPGVIARHTTVSEATAMRWVFVLYAVAGVVTFSIYGRLSEAAEPSGHALPTRLGPSRSIVMRLAGVFMIDALGGGFIVQSLVALWLFRRFELSVGAAGTLFFVIGAISGASGFVAARIARRIGLIRTMAFSHMPANMLLAAAPFAPNVQIALGCLIARSLMSSMDVPARTSYVMAVVGPAERAAAASFTNVPRAFAASLPPIAAGWMLDQSNFGWPIFIGGVLKVAYDVVLLAMFRNVRPPEEAESRVVRAR